MLEKLHIDSEMISTVKWGTGSKLDCPPVRVSFKDTAFAEKEKECNKVYKCARKQTKYNLSITS